MNRSGSALRCLSESYGLEPSATLLVYDDLHLPIGRLRMRAGGSPAGHRGVESAIESMQTEALPRLRLGIGAPPIAESEAGLADYVLGEFLKEEVPRVEAMIERAAEAVTVWLRDGIDAAMRFANAPAPLAADLPEAAQST